MSNPIMYSKTSNDNSKIFNGSSSIDKLEEESPTPINNEATKQLIIRRLMASTSQKQLYAISIVGIAGIGNTSLATTVYENPSVVYHFHTRIWFTVSHFRDSRKILCHILTSLIGYMPEFYEMGFGELSEQLGKLLMGLRYLIVMDDVWDVRVWNDLRRYFPDDKCGSRVMLTGRIGEVGFESQFDGCGFRCLQFSIENGSWVPLEENLGKMKRKEILFPNGNIGSSRMSGPSVEEENVVGFDGEAVKLIKRLTGMRKQLEVISIVGMGGLGKTTLARKVYNDPYVVYSFCIRSWTSVSQSYRKKDLLLAILSSILQLQDGSCEMSEQELSDVLRKKLIGHKYLIVMDDMWDIGAWDDLKRSFPDTKDGSRIMITSRLTDVGLGAQPNRDPHYLGFLNGFHSWALLQQKVFREESCPQELIEIGMQISRKCQGLPLAVVVIAGLLANKKTLDWWSHVSESVSSYMFRDPTQYMETLALSYNHLPRHLKPCFLYFGAFSKDYNIPVWKLILLWIAEGFIHQIGGKNFEDVAKGYLTDLINRNLVIVADKGSDAEIKACRIHDLLHDLCLRKAKKQNFLQQIYDSTPLMKKPTRLSIHSCDCYQVPLMPSAHPHVNSLLCFAFEDSKKFHLDYMSFICQSYKLLRVLDLSAINILFFRREMLQLVSLRYLALRLEYGGFPTSIQKLQNLETLIVISSRVFTIPRNTWKMVKLRHLYIESVEPNDIEDPSFEEAHTSDGFPAMLENLQTISFVCPSQSCQDVLARTPNLRKLGLCGPLISELGTSMFPDLTCANHLEKLKVVNTKIISSRSKFWSCNPMSFPDRLKKLTLAGTVLRWKEMWMIGMLPNLEVLKLKDGAFIGRIWDTDDGGFRRLKFLKFQSLKIVQWNASSNHFPCLRRLVLYSCQKLREIPPGLGDISTLEIIEVNWCSNSANNSARSVQKDQEDKGNDCLKIIINTRRNYASIRRPSKSLQYPYPHVIYSRLHGR